MSHLHHTNPGTWSAADSAAMVGADPVRRAVQTVEGPTLHDRETEFGRGLASADRSPTCFGRSSRATACSSGPGRPSRAAARFVRCGVAALAAALLLAGCGGAETATVPVDAAVPVDPAAAGTTVGDAGGVTAPLTEGSDSGVPGANEISSADATVGKTVKVSAATPKQFRAAHCSRQVLVIYHQPKSIVDTKLLAEGRAAAASVPGTVTLVYTPRDVKAAGDLPAKLGLFATPGIATVGRDGRIENFWTTYVDRALVQRSLLNAAAARPCKVSAAEVPAPDSPAEQSAFAQAADAARSGAKPAAASASGGAADAGAAAAPAAADPALAAAAAAAAGSPDPAAGASAG